MIASIRRSTMLAAVISLFSGAAFAQQQDLGPNAADRDENGILTPAEISAWLDVLTAVEAERTREATGYIVQIRAARAEEGSGVHMATDRIATIAGNPCATATKPILRDSVSASDVMSCKGINANDGGARLAFQSDKVSGIDSLSATFGLAVPLRFGSGIRTGTRLGTLERPYLAEWVTALYGEADGTIRSEADDSGYLEAGIIVGAAFDVAKNTDLIASGKAFARTDMDFNARVFGASLSLTPINLNWRLGGLNGDGTEKMPDRLIYWTASVDLEGLRVNEPGYFSLVADTDYLFAGANLGLVYQDLTIGQHGIKFTAGISYHKDLLSRADAVRTDAGISIYLDDKRKTALDLTRTTGEAYGSLNEVDRTSLSLSFKF